MINKLGEANLRGKYWLVETEYGLRTFIDPKHLTPLSKDRAYFVADSGVEKKWYCIGQGLNKCGKEQYKKGHYLDPQNIYAQAELSTFKEKGFSDFNYIISKSKDCT